MNKGLNTFSWNLRYDGATQFDGMIIWSARPQLGPIAPPGSYKIILTVDDKVFNSSIDLIKDPRIEVSDEDIDIQFKFAMDINYQFWPRICPQCWSCKVFRFLDRFYRRRRNSRS